MSGIADDNLRDAVIAMRAPAAVGHLPTTLEALGMVIAQSAILIATALCASKESGDAA